MEFFTSLPVFFKVLITFALILASNRAGLQLGLAILLCALGLHVWTGGTPETIAELIPAALSSETLMLLLLIFLLLLFTEILNISGRITKTVSALKRRMNKPGLLAIGFPALIGLLPMPGGALVSAPLVAEVDTADAVAAERKVALNYWFRHVWEYWWPLYPGVVLTLKYSNLSIVSLVAFQLPMSIAAITGGIFFIARRMGIRKEKSDETPSPHRHVFAALWPIGLLVSLSITGSILLTMQGIAKTSATLLAMTIALIICSVAVVLRSRNVVRKCIPFVKSAKTRWLLILIVAVQFFSQVLKMQTGCGSDSIITQMSSELMAFGIPLLAVIMVIPFIAGIVMGIAVGFVGVSFPLVFGLIGAAAPPHIRVPATVLAFGFGFMGMMLSPIHVCFIVSGEYFNTSIIRSYRYLWKPVAVVLATTMLSSGCYYWFLK